MKSFVNKKIFIESNEYTYRVDFFDNYIDRTWVERHYGYKIKDD